MTTAVWDDGCGHDDWEMMIAETEGWGHGPAGPRACDTPEGMVTVMGSKLLLGSHSQYLRSHARIPRR